MKLGHDKADGFPTSFQYMIRRRSRCYGSPPIPESSLAGYCQHRPLEILSYTDYNTASAETNGQMPY